MFKKSFYLLFLAFIALFALVACGENPDNGGEKDKKQAEIELLLDEEYNVGAEEDIIVNVFNAKASDIQWEIEDESILKIEDGKVKALKAGTTKVTAKIGDVTASATVTVKQSAVRIEFELNGGEAVEELPTTRDGSIAIMLPAAKKAGYKFEGWFENAEGTGTKVEKLDSSNMTITKLYAKWSDLVYELTYSLIDATGKTKTDKVTCKASEALKLKDVTAEGNNVFSGWYLDEGLVYEVTELKANTIDEEKVTVYGKVVNKAIPFKANFVFNGGSNTYATKSAMVTDFLVDYGAYAKKSYRTPSQLGTSTTTPVNMHTFFQSELSDGTKVMDKWGWVLEYIYDISTLKLDSTNYTMSAVKGLLNGKFNDTDNNKKAVSISVRAFMIGTQIGSEKIASVDFSTYANSNGFWKYLAKAQEFEDSVGCLNSELPELFKENLTFGGWYRDEDLTEGPVKNVYANCTLYAKWDESVPVTSISIDNAPDGVIKFEKFPLEWTIKPGDANIQGVVFSSSDTSIATIGDDGIIHAIKSGKVTIKIVSESASKASDEIEVEIYTPDYFNVSFENNSYVMVGESIKVTADYQGRNAKPDTKLTWLSLDNSIATVKDGVITGVKAGFVKIRVGAEGTASNFDFGVTVLDQNSSDIAKFLASANNAQIFTKDNLMVGDPGGDTTYFRDIFGSVSKILYNKPFVIDTKYEAAALADKNNRGSSTFNTEIQPSTEFITVHYTGNMSKGSTASSNANYMCQTSSAVSIHYVTGNDGVYHCLPDNYIAWHAGDGTSTKFEWYPTGVMYKEGDPEWIDYDVSENGNYMINGQETTVKVPARSDGIKVTGKTFIKDGKECPTFNQMGIPFTIKDGQYYIGTTYWCSNFYSAGVIGSHGGNNNSIGIESAVNPESDLWLTWQMTAQLVGKLLIENNLPITRVVGHHFYTAKNCPQPLIENDNEIWWEFIELVRAERDLREKYSNYEISMTFVDKPGNVNSYGRVNAYINDGSQAITYKVTIKNKTTQAIEEITLSSILHSKYECCAE